ncbi:hypothetical protein HRG_010793 [Hirsutella rhossiliensis]|uniref:Uncharacterized protein n=1 Tax=Hirsutella rhossiliensis TaxID=111463 RepID=A0A9P8SCX0_9HYPO|nr:uncharacterized protein HRG_10793 [Hirsutella rhossiliensis]KAH0958098.1 hypothetical protein HRG_10793 [Hirsutella rhossiliensis]
MPATNMTPADASSTSTVYLRTQPPAWAMLQAGLSVFAVLIIARHCVRWLCLRWCGSADNRLTVQAFTDGPRDQRTQQQRPRWEVVDEKPWYAPSLTTTMPSDQKTVVPEGGQLGSGTALPGDRNWKCGSDSLPRPFVSRLPPAPPLTPPELSPAVFTIEDAPHRQDSFIHQPNPDYMTSTSSFSETSPEPSSRPRRRSYHRTIPIGTPAPRQASSSEADVADLNFSPSSYPPSSPLLPPPPPGAYGAEGLGQARRGVDVKGEIISVLDGGGGGWTRHTRVYGGGVCLACAASGGQHGGGFYGATVAPEEMR